MPAVRTKRLAKLPLFTGTEAWAGIIGILIIAAILQLTFAHWAGVRERYFFLVLPVLFAVVYVGTWQAIAAALLAGITGIAIPFVGGITSKLGIVPDLIGFIVLSSLFIWVGSRLRIWRGEAMQAIDTAERNVQVQRDLSDELTLLIDGAANHAIYMLDPEGQVTIWNKGAERIKGWPESEAIGLHLCRFYPADEIAEGKPAEDLDRARKLGRFEEKSWRVRKDGSEFLADSTLTALYDEGGALRGFGKVVRDITEQFAAEKAIEAREIHLRSILATVPDAMIVIDDAGMISSFSAAAERLFGYKEQDIIGRNVAILMPSPDGEQHDAHIRRYVDSGVPHIIGRVRRVMAKRNDGTLFPVELAVGEAAGGGRHMFTGFIRDISERERTRERLQALQTELIHVSRLSAMGTMASTLAHELNQPITAVANYVETVRDMLKQPDPAQNATMCHALEEAAREAMRAGHIVRRLREFIARKDVDKHVESLPGLIDSASALGLIDAREKRVEIRFDLDPQPRPILVDGVQVQQVIINLQRNAIEAMSGSAVRRLTVSTRPHAPGFTRVSIEDTGTGLGPDTDGKLFNAFYSTKQDGMGLGLSICRTIVESHGGRIWAEANPAGGSCFHFTLMDATDTHMEDGDG